MAARTLGLDTATALVVGEVIGAGIFLTPAEITKALGSAVLKPRLSIFGLLVKNEAVERTVVATAANVATDCPERLA